MGDIQMALCLTDESKISVLFIIMNESQLVSWWIYMHAHSFILSPFFMDINSIYLSRCYFHCVCMWCKSLQYDIFHLLTILYVWLAGFFFFVVVYVLYGMRRYVYICILATGAAPNSHFSPEFRTIFYGINLHLICILNGNQFTRSNLYGILSIYSVW